VTAAAQEQAGSGGALLALQRDHPLAFAKLWHRDEPRTSQRRAFQNLGDIFTIICGGNRSGKTAGCGQYIAACMHGRSHPDARAWCRANGIPLSALPARPGVCWAVALDSSDSREYLRPALEQYLPPSAKWRNRFGFGQAEVEIPGLGRCVFKAVSEGRDGFQGTAIDRCWFDEEPPDRSVVNEAIMRTADRRGSVIFSLTPLRGKTWIYDRWIAQPPDDTRVHWLHGEDNPHVPADALAAVLAQYGPHERAARARGEWTALEGRIYSEFSRATHVIPTAEIEPGSPIWIGVDFGTRAPFAAVVCTVTGDDVLTVIDEHYQAGETLAVHAAKLKQLIERYGEPEWIVCDPADRGARLALMREHGIPNVGARKGPSSVMRGIGAVAERMAFDVEGRPHLVIMDRCRNLIAEIESYTWDARGHGEPRDRPADRQRDHACDALRYLVSKLAVSTMAIG
jgi:phage terminase large subunit-like protein